MTSSSSDDSCIETDGEGEDVVEETNQINVSTTSESPYLALEQETMTMVAKLRLNPLLPKGVDADSGERVTGLCCGLCDACGPPEEWKEAHVGVAERLWLGEHLREIHKDEFDRMHAAATRCYSALPTGMPLNDELLLALYTQI